METSIGGFISKTIEEIKSGLPDGYEIENEIQFEISIISSQNKRGGITLKIANGEIDREKQTVQNIKFSVVNPKKKKENLDSEAETYLKHIDTGLNLLKNLGETKKVKGSH